MALTVTNQLTTIIDCDDATNWTGSDATIGLDTDIYYEPTGSIAHDLDNETYYATYTWASDQDFTNIAVYWWWMNMTAPNLDTWANGGIGLRLEDGSANWSEWWVGGSDTYKGGWRRFVVYTGSTPDDQSATAPTMTQIRKLHIRSKATAKSKLADNTFIDYIQTGNTGIKVTGGTTGDKDFAELVAQNDSVYAGLIRESGGVYFINGPIQFGDNSSGDVNFLDTNQVIMAENWFRSFTTSFRTSAESLVSSTHFTLSVVNNASGDGKFQLGSKSGTRGVEGCVLKSGESGTSGRKIILTATDTDIDELKLYGCSCIDMGQISLPPTATGREALDTSFSGCGEVLADTCIVQYCNFVNADDRGIRMSSASHNITDCNFINCGHGVHIPNTGTYSFSDLVFTGCTYDIENSSAGLVTVNASGTSNPGTYENTGSGSTVINNTKTLSVEVLDTGNNAIEGAQVWIQKRVDDTDVGHPGNPFTSAAGNSRGDADFVVSESIPADLPSSGWLLVQDISTGELQSYRYASITTGTNTFNLKSEVTGTDNGTGNETTINEAGIGAKDIVEGDTIRMTNSPFNWAIVLSVSANSVTTTALSGGDSWASEPYGVHRLAVDYDGTPGSEDTATVPLMNEETNASGIATEDYNFGGNKDIIVRVRLASGGTDYFPLSTSQTIGSNGLDIIVTLAEDMIKS